MGVDRRGSLDSETGAMTSNSLIFVLVVCIAGCGDPTAWVPDHAHEMRASCLIEGVPPEALMAGCRMSKVSSITGRTSYAGCVSTHRHEPTGSFLCDLLFQEPGEWRLDVILVRDENGTVGHIPRNLVTRVLPEEDFL